MRTLAVDNVGSTARDWCMLERNILSHIKLCLLLSFLSWAILLHARLTNSPSEAEPPSRSKSTLPLAIVLICSALVSLVSGVWEYIWGVRDLQNQRAFLVASRPHAVALTVISGIILCTCVVLLADKSLSSS